MSNKRKVHPILYISQVEESLKEFILTQDRTESLTDLKEFHNEIRKRIYETRVIGVGKNLNKNSIAILIYDIEAKEDNFYDQKIDENGQPYIMY